MTPQQMIRISGSSNNYQPNASLHRHAHYEILFIEIGGGTHIIDHTEHEVLDNQIFFLRPGQIHQFKPTKVTQFTFIAFDTNSLKSNTSVPLNRFEFFQSFQHSGPLILDSLSKIKPYLLRVTNELKKPEDVNQQALISAHLLILLIKLQRVFIAYSKRDEAAKNIPILVKEFNKMLDNTEVIYRFVHNYAKSLHVTSNYLNECIKKYTGKPASYWIHDKLILESKRLLNEGTLNISQISRQLLFPNASQFSRFFKQCTGQSPKTFKSFYNTV